MKTLTFLLALLLCLPAALVSAREPVASGGQRPPAPPPSPVEEDMIGCDRAVAERCLSAAERTELRLAPGWSEPVLAAAVAAARQVYHKTEDVDAALAAARAAAATAFFFRRASIRSRLCRRGGC